MMRPQFLTFAVTLGVALACARQASAQEATPATAQAQPPSADSGTRLPRFQGGAGALIGVPLGRFGDNVEISTGPSLHFGVGLGRSPVSLGGEVSLQSYGRQNRQEHLASIPDLAVTVETTNDFWLVHGRVRAQRRTGRLRPYVDGLLGFIDLSTTTSVKCGSGSAGCGDVIDDLQDFALSTGGGAGIMVGILPSRDSLRLDISLRYLHGGEANYLKEGAIRFEGGAPILNVVRSRTSLLTVYIGLAAGR